MAVVGLHATTATVVVSRSDDCIAIFLGSCAAYKQQARHEPGTYYLTKGWIEVGDSPFFRASETRREIWRVKAMRNDEVDAKELQAPGLHQHRPV